MSKQDYRIARRMIRDNGLYALRWMPVHQSSVMCRLATQKKDMLTEKAEDMRILSLANWYNL